MRLNLILPGMLAFGKAMQAHSCIRPCALDLSVSVKRTSVQTLNASFERVSAMIAKQQVKPLPAVTYDFGSIHEALRQFSAAKHVGKIVVQLPGTAEQGSAADPSSNNKGAWIVTGGLGALGVLNAKWLVGQGKKCLQLLGRSGR